MTEQVQFYDATYSRFQLSARRRVRAETFAQDEGQNSWLTTDEWRVALDRLELRPGSRALDVACGSGGPDLFLARTTGAEVVGVDINRHAIETANELARRQGLNTLARFQLADAARPLPFEDESFDAIICIDSINHLPDRLSVLCDWHRLLKPGGHVMFTDPIVVTGHLSSEEIALRASIGFFVFSLLDDDKRLIREAGLRPGQLRGHDPQRRPGGAPLARGAGVPPRRAVRRRRRRDLRGDAEFPVGRPRAG